MTTTTPQYTILSDEYAEVVAVHHPLVRARGFSTVNPGEVVLFEDNTLGQVLSFDEAGIDIMVFGAKPVLIKSRIHRTTTQLSFPIAPTLLGSIYSPLGEVKVAAPATVAKEKTETTFRPVFLTPRAIPTRKRITKQLLTGFNTTDILLPVGHGQRELLVGDRKAGKSDFARGTALTQAQAGTIVIYALIGKKLSDIKKTYEFFKKNQVLDKVLLIVSSSQDPVSTISITPHAALTVAEAFSEQGRNVLVILDDLTSHAEFYREISLLAKRFPGRDSYPGDIFFNHAQLLERAGTFEHPTNKNETVSITCLPIARTSNSDLTDFITSNLISITDGHLLFDTKLFAQGIRPALNTSLSVTRVGKQTQTALQRDVNQQLTSFLTTFRKTKNLTHLGSEISTKSQEILKKGELLQLFFSDDGKAALPVTIQLLIIGFIWLGWFAQTHTNVMTNATFKLLQSYQQQESTRTNLDALITARASFSELLAAITENEQQLLALCQI